MTSSVVDEITGKSATPWRGILTQSIILLLAVSVVKGAADPPAASPTLKLTLRETVQLALRQNPQVQIANLNIAETQENQTIARFSAAAPSQPRHFGCTAACKLGDRVRSEISGTSGEPRSVLYRASRIPLMLLMKRIRPRKTEIVAE